ncbi:hypothetical protein C6500_19855 [Candidatus Poribacteria bacterium]|nr:MAG: hypothetical protein C6500_19855 [Candidatus Poribacteria bacterium]
MCVVLQRALVALPTLWKSSRLRSCLADSFLLLIHLYILARMTKTASSLYPCQTGWYMPPQVPMNFRGQAWFFQTVEQILIDDPTLDLNARDSQGMTALHYAVQRGSAEMVKTLLAQAGIKVNLLNGHRRTPAQLARVLKQIHLAKMINAHPSAKWPLIAWDVSPKGSLTTTWGALKRRQ